MGLLKLLTRGQIENMVGDPSRFDRVVDQFGISRILKIVIGSSAGNGQPMLPTACTVLGVRAQRRLGRDCDEESWYKILVLERFVDWDTVEGPIRECLALFGIFPNSEECPIPLGLKGTLPAKKVRRRRGARGTHN